MVFFLLRPDVMFEPHTYMKHNFTEGIQEALNSFISGLQFYGSFIMFYFVQNL